jgi:hypothetical protein
MLRYLIMLLAALQGAVPPAVAQWESLNEGVSHEVRGFRVKDDRLLVCGSFIYVREDSLRANSLAWWDGEHWSIEGLADGNGHPTGNNAPTFTAAFRDDTLFVSHISSFWHMDPTMRKLAMLVDGDWQYCGAPDNWTFLIDANDRLFMGGRSDTLYGQYMPLINEWTNGQWQTLNNSPFNNTGTVYHGTYWKDNYYFVGSFLAGDARSIIRFDGIDTWTSLGDGVYGNHINRVCGYGDSLYIGGFLPPGQGIVSNHIRIWDGETYRSFFPQLDMMGQIVDMKVHDDKLYIASNFRIPGDTTLYGLLRYDGHQLCVLGGNMPAGSGPIEFFQDHIYMGLPPLHPWLYWENIGRIPIDIIPDTCISVSSTSIAENKEEGPLVIHPNPAGDVIRLPEDLASGALITVHDGMGRLVMPGFHVKDTNGSIDVSRLAPSLYWIHLEYPGQTMRTGRFMKL